MPINAPQEYYNLELAYSKERDPEEKKRILGEMLRLLPKHKGTDRAFAALKRRMSLLKKSMNRSAQTHKTLSIRKRWPRVSLIGYEQSRILTRFNLTKVADIYYGIAKINGIPVQLLLIQDPEKYRDLLIQSEIIISKIKLNDIAGFQVISDTPDVASALKAYGVIGVFTENSSDAIALQDGSTVKTLAEKLHLETKKNTYAIIYGNSAKFQGQRVGLDHKLKNDDRVFIRI
jgi:ribosome-interacting GTPase 1